MAKKEFKVGEVFQCGFVKLKCVKSDTFFCDGCFLKDYCVSDLQCRKIVGLCGIGREDNNNVIFVKVDE